MKSFFPDQIYVSKRIRLFMWANLVVQIGIVVTGGLVRLTGSGLGCDTWPECTSGSVTPTAAQGIGWGKYIEFGNRLLTFVLIVVAIGLFWAIRTSRPKRFHLLKPVILVGIGIIAQAIIGGISVLLQLAPLWVGVHFLVSMFLVAISSWLVWRAYENDAIPADAAPAMVKILGHLTSVVLAAILTLGVIVTGAGPHSGDDEVFNRFSIDLRMVAWLHADLVMLFLGLVAGTYVAVRAGTRGNEFFQNLGRRSARVWAFVFFVALAQGALGYTQYFTGLPISLVNLHMLGAALLTVALTWALSSLKYRI